MQRKNYLLSKSRSGFAMIMAIVVIVIITTIMTLSLSMTTETVKKTTDLYLYEQAILYSKSAAELALLDIAKNGCTNNFNTNFPDSSGTASIYNANVTMKYVYTGTVTGCEDYFTIITPEQSGSVLMDITVTTNAGTEPIRYFRRSIQKL
ncbi:hypothetical protein [Sulfurimonas sp.]|uniref:hypothetical protein n=1 Tax=Sulfurimonas sp. TaxID=2022749 RepID=UPI003565D00B